MDAMVFNNRVILLGGTGSQRRRAYLVRGSLSFRQHLIQGYKRMDLVMSDKSVVRTPYGHKVVARRRAANRVAKQARKVNR